MLRFGGIIAGAALPFPIDKPRRGWYTEFVCGYGGIGRRARLRIWYLRCAGSTPVTRTTSEWTALHSKSPAGWPGFSHIAPSFLLLPAEFCRCKLPRGPRPPCGRLIDFAPFKKPGRLAGLFSYRSVIPSRPKSRRLRGGWPRNAPAGAVLLPTNFCCANFRGGPGRPAGGLWTALYLKRPAAWLGVCHVTAFFNSDLWLSCARFLAAAFFCASRARPPTRQKTRGSERQREKRTAAPAERGRR